MGAKNVIVIGGGPAGYVAAIRAAQLGARVTLVEKDAIGGTCLNRGCIPTKSLLHDAKLLRSLRGSPVFQSLVPDDFNPFSSMMERKDAVVRELVKGLEVVLQSHRVNVRCARAELLSAHRVLLVYGDEKREVVEGDAIILAPGSKSKGLPGISPDEDRIVTSDGALKLEEIPKDIVIVGGGYIGVEFATLFNALGSKVTIVEILDTILPGLEGELVRNLRRSLENRKVRILTGSRIEELDDHGEKLRMTLKTGGGIEELTASRLLIAIGRIPNLDLDYGRVGVEVTPHGIKVDDRMETTVPNLYAIGDATGGTMLAHVAMEEGGIAAENIAGLDRKREDSFTPVCIFTDPEIASVGMTEKEARARGEVKIGRFPFRSNPKALLCGEGEGLIKVVADRESDRILGAHIFGQEASALISIVSCLMKQEMTIKEFSRMIQAHPTTAEALREAFLDGDGMAIHLPRPLRRRA